MPYVEYRNSQIVGVYAKPQPGYAETEVPDDHPDVLAFAERIAAPPARVGVSDLIAALEKKGAVTKAEVEAVAEARIEAEVSADRRIVGKRGK